MSLKRLPTDEEIDMLAAQFGKLWRQGDVLRPWLRQHRDLLLALIHGGWPWAAVAQALTKAGITYRTEKPWTAKWLRSDFSRAQVPLKGYARRKQSVEIWPSNQGAISHQAQKALPAPADYDSGDSEEPEFKLARFIDWDEKRGGADGEPSGRAAAPAQPSQRYVEIMEQLTGKKPPG